MRPHCRECQGEGQIFEGAFMNSNPSHYGDYDEVWRPCDRCHGTGYTWKDFRFGWLKWQWQQWTQQPVEEIDIPF